MEASIGPEILHDDMLRTRKLCNEDKAWNHSFALADIAIPSRYNSLISGRFWKNIAIFGLPSFSLWGEEIEDKSRVTNLLRWKISCGICPSKPAFEKFKYLKLFNLHSSEGITELKLLKAKFKLWRYWRSKRMLELRSLPEIDYSLRSRAITRPSSHVTPCHWQQSSFSFQRVSFLDNEGLKIRLVLKWSNMEHCLSSK